LNLIPEVMVSVSNREHSRPPVPGSVFVPSEVPP
jgi:hypothetical protein